MENTTTTMRIEEISSETISGATTINEEIDITTIETPQGIREHHHRHHHHKHHHHRHHQQTKEEEEATTLTITDVSDEQKVMETKQLEEAEEEEEQHTQHHHHHQHKHKQAALQLSLPPPLPDSSPPYLTPTEEGDQLVWLTDLDASPQQSMASAAQPNPPVIQTPPSPTNFRRSQPPATPSPTGTVRQTARIIESQLHLSAPPTPAATTEQTVGPPDSNTPPQQPAPKTVQQQPQQVPSTPNSSGWVVQRLAVVSTQPAATGASPPLTPVTPPTASPSRAAVSQMEIITVTPLRTAAPPAPPMLLVGKVSVDHNDTRSKNYRVSTDSSEAASQGIKKRCCCAIC
ncbi:PREDICTED: bromodomain-containing protein 4 isoform X1 [Drosophila arizonae]|uniref:Bromodomain-containing protein 4 isoform X1 n=1 Tax=Drosophila arizonae TaxID=7263 RepID=A0ABM1PMR2_DROAR|nr:PREDICTED: bromodomain-containing protein 4 isoform X1 [Drosophila arizonae]